MVQHFHEINPITIKSKSGLPRQKLVYHTHTYISNTKNYFRDKEHFREFLNTLYKEKSPSKESGRQDDIKEDTEANKKRAKFIEKNSAKEKN